MFSITFEQRTRRKPAKTPAVYGRIVAGRLNERFESPLGFWDEGAYRSQWYRAIDHIVSGGDRDALITSICNPDEPDFGMWWVMYREKETVFLQNRLIFPAEAKKETELENLGRWIGEHRTLNEDGERISEWSVSVGDLAVFRSASE